MNCNLCIKPSVIIALQLTLLLGIVSCKESIDQEVMSAQEAWKGKRLTLNLSEFKKINEEEWVLPEYSNYSLLHYVNVDCSICVAEMKEWAKYLDDNVNNSHLNILFIASGDHEAFIEHLVTTNEIDFNYPIYFDKYNQFYQDNGIVSDKRFHTFVINNFDEIEFIGNPLKVDGLSKFLEKKYFK